MSRTGVIAAVLGLLAGPLLAETGAPRVFAFIDVEGGDGFTTLAGRILAPEGAPEVTGEFEVERISDSGRLRSAQSRTLPLSPAEDEVIGTIRINTAAGESVSARLVVLSGTEVVAVSTLSLGDAAMTDTE